MDEIRMGEKTGIEWTGKTWNPWQGCTKVSPGCANCYMYREKTRWGQDPNIVVKSKPTTFNAPLKWKEPGLVFTCSWSDWFHEDADEWRDEAWEIIRKTPHLTYQILTKRPERIKDNLPDDWGEGYSNVWLGVSVENQKMADKRIPILLKIPAKIRFLSLEPLLDEVYLDPYMGYFWECLECQYDWEEAGDSLTNLRGPHFCYLCSSDCGHEGHVVLGGKSIHWVIVGGESGPDARPMEIEWAQRIRNKCRGIGAKFFLKQLGGWPDKRGGDKAVLAGATWTEIPGVTE